MYLGRITEVFSKRLQMNIAENWNMHIAFLKCLKLALKAFISVFNAIVRHVELICNV